MQKNLFKPVKDFFSPLRTSKHSPSLQHPPEIGMIPTPLYEALIPQPKLTEAQHRRNIENIELAKMEQERETANNNLVAQHRIMVVTVIATFIALFSAIAAIFIALNQTPAAAPIVNVAPAQQTPPDVKVYVTPQQDESNVRS